MASYVLSSKALVLLLLTFIVLTQARTSKPFSPLQVSREDYQKFIRDPATLSRASTDFGQAVYRTPYAVFAPTSVSDIATLIKFSNSLPIPFTIAPRGQAHSVHGQPLASHGVVVNMTELNKGERSRIVVVADDGKGTGPYADVGGGQTWNDLLQATLKYGLSPQSWTNYLYASVAGTLTNAGIGGQSFRYGPQISNVHEIDVVTGKGDTVTCSRKNNSDLYYAVLGGLGQFGIITRARIAIAPAPRRVKWIRVVYTDFAAYARDQEYLISFNGRNDPNAADSVEGLILLNQPQIDLSFYPPDDHPRIKSLLTQHGIIYITEIIKYYDNSQDQVSEVVRQLTNGLKFLPKLIFEKDVSYEDYLNRIHAVEVLAKKQGLREVPQAWLNLYVPRSRISDFDQGAFKDIIVKQNLSITTLVIHPVNRNKWDNRMSVVIPDEEVFYRVSFLHSTVLKKVEEYEGQYRRILEFCTKAGIKVKHYLPQYLTTHENWVEHFGPKWEVFKQRKDRYDPNRILTPGQGIIF